MCEAAPFYKEYHSDATIHQVTTVLATSKNGKEYHSDATIHQVTT